MTNTQPNKKIITTRILVPANTLPGAPVIRTVTTPLPLLESYRVSIFSAADAVTPIETGFRFTTNGLTIAPAPGSLDDLTIESFHPVDYRTIEDAEINHALPGPPYELDILLYNADGAAAVYYLFVFQFAAQETPVTPALKDHAVND